MNYNKKQILDYIKAIEHLSLFLKELLEQENKLSPEPVTITDKIKETASLKLMCKKGNWPEAIPEEYICGEDYDSRMFRAYGIIEQYLQSVDLTQKKFLDFGCGDGLVAEIALKFGVEVSVGYDIKPDDLWDKIEKKDNLIVTNNLDDLIGYKFDLILLNDVLDHCDDPDEVLQTISSLLTENGTVYCRCHPWTSRHGSHTYKKLNKAFVHLIFTDEELYRLDIDLVKKLTTLDPITTYQEIIKKNNFTIKSEKTIITPVEILFSLDPVIVRRIKNHWIEQGDNAYADGDAFPREILEIDFVDYVLEKKQD
jgi:2-polyprenyl-3-methyl-5-hydroxy-6-metoxy-1,4-benzoquinol methylase